mgnify:CR=1 FL=1
MTYQKSSDRYKQILEFLINYDQENRHSPSYEEICEGVQLKAKSHVSKLLDELEDRGFIAREKNNPRSIRILDEAFFFITRGVTRVVRKVEEILVIPIQGRIVASEPIPIPESISTVYDPDSAIEILLSSLPANERKKELFALEVEGDSMVDAMVNDGDIVIFHKAATAQNRDMVAVWLEEKSETTLKYYFRETVKEDGKERERVRLQPANPTMQPIYINNPEQVRIMGKVVMVIRRPNSPRQLRRPVQKSPRAQGTLFAQI